MTVGPVTATLLALGLVGCTPFNGGGGGGRLGSGGDRATLVLFAEDQAGRDIGSFQMTLTGITLTSSAGDEVSLLPAAVELEWTGHSLAPTVLSVTQVPAATYTQLTVLVSSPQMTLFNSATGRFESFSPSLTTSSVQISINRTLTASQVLGLRLDVDLLNSVVSTTQVTPRFALIPTSFAADELPGDIDDAVGRVASVEAANNRFTMTVNPSNTSSPPAITVLTNASTRFDGLSGLSALRANDEIELDARLQSDGTFLALDVELENQANEERLRGLLVSRTPVSGSTTSVNVLVLEENSPQAAVGVGKTLTVSLDSTTTFQINQEDIRLAEDTRFSGFTFDRASLAPGQVVAIKLKTGTLAAGRVTLKQATLPGTVASVGTTTFTLAPLSGFYILNNLDRITAQPTVNVTEFEDLPQGLVSMRGNQTVAARGLVFPTPPTLVLKRVRLLAPP